MWSWTMGLDPCCKKGARSVCVIARERTKSVDAMLQAAANDCCIDHSKYGGLLRKKPDV